jgi:hypothetical protein
MELLSACLHHMALSRNCCEACLHCMVDGGCLQPVPACNAHKIQCMHVVGHVCMAEHSGGSNTQGSIMFARAVGNLGITSE